jgi:hypothetical protein
MMALRSSVKPRTPTNPSAGPIVRAPPFRAWNCRPVKPRRPDRDRGLAWRNGQNTAADTALARQADAKGKFTRSVVMAAGQHDGVDAPCALFRNHLRAGHRIAPLAGQKQSRAGELPAVHHERALVEIDAQHMVDRMIDIAEGPHEMRQRRVAVPCAVSERATCSSIRMESSSARWRMNWMISPIASFGWCPAMIRINHGDGACVDERIARPALFLLQLNDRVERDQRE